MKIKLKYLKMGRCDFCHEKDENLYRVRKNGKVVGICQPCFYGYYYSKYGDDIEIIDISDNKNNLTLKIEGV